MFKEIVATSLSINEIREKLIKLGYDKHHASAIKKRILSEGIDDSHLKGKHWQKNYFDYGTLRTNTAAKSEKLRLMLIAKRGSTCDCCKNNNWLGYTIPLEVHHIDGDKFNNDESNLVLLCPNCHALTDNYRGKNVNSGKIVVSDAEFAQGLIQSKNIRKA